MTSGGPPRAVAVVDLGFGDAGKGLVTDALARRLRADLVVRFCGGAQAGHNVVTVDGQHHTFAQFGAATFVPGARTLLARGVVVHPTALLAEATALESKGVGAPLERLSVSEEALLVAPWHQAASRLRELARGVARHGSCGVGVGEAVADALAHPDDALRAGDLRDPVRLAGRLARVRARVAASLPGGGARDAQAVRRERRAFDDPGLGAAWAERARPLASRVVSKDEARKALAAAGSVVFEGAQGLLLDERLGFHPHTTWSDCTPREAARLLEDARPGARLSVVGVLRAHGVRHGPGPFPSEDPGVGAAVREHNAANPWQGPVRYGWLDAVLARYALDLTPGLDALVLTHLDALARLGRPRVVTAYEAPLDAPADLVAERAGAGVVRLVADPAPTLGRQARMGALLAACRPVGEEAPADEAGFLAFVERALGRPVDGVARGPSAADLAIADPAVPRLEGRGGASKGA